MNVELKNGKVTRRSLESVIRDVQRTPTNLNERPSRAIYRRMNDITAKAERSAAYRKLQKQYDRARKAERDKDDRKDWMIRNIRWHFVIHGMTPEVRKMVKKLVKEFGKPPEITARFSIERT